MKTWRETTVFKVCEEFNVPCIQVRTISNYVEKRNKESWNIPCVIQNLKCRSRKNNFKFMKLTLGFSPCPNDTFMFDAIVHNMVDTEGLEFDVILSDVEQLNQWAFRM